jgi:hypothetical protein
LLLLAVQLHTQVVVVVDLVELLVELRVQQRLVVEQVVHTTLLVLLEL